MSTISSTWPAPGVADKKWTDKRKQELLDSRVLSTRLLIDHLHEGGGRYSSIVCASAVGYYGSRGADVLSEEEKPGAGFLSDICVAWEKSAAALAEAAGSPTSIMRIGIVLSNHGGALPNISGPVKFGIGSYLGNGAQYCSWIHIDDVCNMIIYAMENKLTGIYNACAPEPVTNKELTRHIARALNRPFIPVPAPAFALKAGNGRDVGYRSEESARKCRQDPASRLQLPV